MRKERNRQSQKSRETDRQDREVGEERGRNSHTYREGPISVHAEGDGHRERGTQREKEKYLPNASIS